MPDTKVSLIVGLVNKASSALKEITNDFAAMKAAGHSAESSFRLGERINQSAEAMTHFSERVKSMMERPIEEATNFQVAMTQIGIRSQLSTEQLDKVRKSAIELGASGEFGVNQVANSLRTLLKPGEDANKALATMPQLMKFASGNMVDLATATGATNSIMKSFGLNLSNVTEITDELTRMSRLTGVSVAEVGGEIAAVGPFAKTLGVDFKDTAAIMGMMAKAGLSSGRAVSTLRMVLMRLGAPGAMKASAGMLKAIGVEAYDAHKNLRPLPEVLGEIGEKTAGMGSAQRLTVMRRLFGMGGGSVAAMFEGLGEGGIKAYLANMASVEGETDKASEAMDKTAEVAGKRLTAATQALNTSLGESLLPSIARWKNLQADVIGGVAKLATQHSTATAVVMGTGRTFATVAGAAAELTKTLAAVAGASGLVAILTGGKMTAATLVSKLIPALNLAKVAAIGFNAALAGGVIASAYWAVGKWVEVFKTAKEVNRSQKESEDFGAQIAKKKAEMALGAPGAAGFRKTETPEATLGKGQIHIHVTTDGKATAQVKKLKNPDNIDLSASLGMMALEPI